MKWCYVWAAKIFPRVVLSKMLCDVSFIRRNKAGPHSGSGSTPPLRSPPTSSPRCTLPSSTRSSQAREAAHCWRPVGHPTVWDEVWCAHLSQKVHFRRSFRLLTLPLHVGHVMQGVLYNGEARGGYMLHVFVHICGFFLHSLLPEKFHQNNRFLVESLKDQRFSKI